jgi:hypothetical protein
MPVVMSSQAGHRAVDATLCRRSSPAPAILTRSSTRVSSRVLFRRGTFRHAPNSAHAARNPTRVQAAALEMGTRAIKKFAQASKTPVFVSGA